jgi:hypothetical protein
MRTPLWAANAVSKAPHVARTGSAGQRREKFFENCPPTDSGAGENERSSALSRRHWCSLQHLEEAMKTIVSALIALSVLAGIAAPASAMDAETFYEQQDRVSY